MATQQFDIVLDTEAPAFEVAAVLDGVDYVLTIGYNARDEEWYLDLADANADPIVAGQPLIEGWPLLSLYKRTDTRAPQGDLWLVGSSLVYVEAE